MCPAQTVRALKAAGGPLATGLAFHEKATGIVNEEVAKAVLGHAAKLVGSHAGNRDYITQARKSLVKLQDVFWLVDESDANQVGRLLCDCDRILGASQPLAGL